MRHNREPLDFIAAAVLHRALTCSREARAREALIDPAERAAAARLIAAGLLEDDHGFLRPTPRAEATFQATPRAPLAPLTTSVPARGTTRCALAT